MIQKLTTYIQSRPIGVWVLALGALMTLGFAPFFLWPLAMMSVAGFYLLAKRANGWKQAVGLGFVWGIGHQVTALYWLPRSFYLDAGESWIAGIFGGIPAMLVVAAYGALGMALVAWATWRAPRFKGVVFVAAWVLLDALKALTPYGFPWLPAGAAWGGDLFGYPVFAQMAAYGGVFLLSIVFLAISLVVSGGGWRRVGVAAALIAAVATFGVVRLTTAPESVTSTAPDAPVIRMVQPNIQSAHKWDAQMRLRFLEDTLRTAFQPATSGQVPQVLVMPETAVAFYLDREPEIQRFIASFMTSGQVLLTGTVREERDPRTGAPQFGNSFAAVDSNGQIRGYYNKQLLVPFGEFIPLRGVIDAVTPYLPFAANIRTLSQSRLDFAFGTLDPRLNTPAGTVASLICYEGIFPWHVARYSPGVDWLVNITNDNWFTGTTALAQHATLARLRAIETGLPLIRVANTGITVAFDGWGREAGRLPINTPVVLDVPLPARVPGGAPFAKIISGRL